MDLYMKKFTLSVVICTKDRYIDIIETVKSILTQTILPNELVIIDQSSGNRIEKAIRNLLSKRGKKKEFFKYIHNPKISGLTTARNVGIQESVGDIILFLDDDVILENDFFAQIMEIHERDPSIGGVGGVVTNYKASFIRQLLFRTFYVGPFKDERQKIYWNLNKYGKFDIITTSKIGGGLMSFKRGFLSDIKFDENFRGYSLGEDFDFSYRFSLRHKLVINPNARLYHKGSPKNRGNFKKYTEARICTLFYFFKKNLNKELCNCLCFFWAITGDLVFGFLASVSKKTIAPLVGVFSGYWKIINNLRECDFIVMERYRRKKRL